MSNSKSSTLKSQTNSDQVLDYARKTYPDCRWEVTKARGIPAVQCFKGKIYSAALYQPPEDGLAQRIGRKTIPYYKHIVNELHEQLEKV